MQRGTSLILGYLATAEMVGVKNHAEVVINTDMWMPEGLNLNLETLTILEGHIDTKLFRFSL